MYHYSWLMMRSTAGTPSAERDPVVTPRRMDIIYTKLKNGSLKLYELEKELPPLDAIRARREFIEKETGTTLENLGIFSIDIERVVKRNCENMIGTVQVPVGVAGPLLVQGEYAQGSYYLPLATTEGALVASVNRGCSAITRAGGAQVRILHDGMTRAPVFAADSVVHAKQVADWVAAHRDELRAAAESTTSHGKMTDVVTYIAGTSVFVRIEFDTKDAMGMNMVTIASAKVAELIAQGTGARLIALSGNMCTDKKPAAINGIMGRGRSVVAGVALSHDTISQIFKTDAKNLFEVNYRKNLVGSARAGSMGFNAHAANVVAAHVHCLRAGRSSCNRWQHLHYNGGSYGFRCHMSQSPSPHSRWEQLAGEPGLETQQECLRILGVAGGGNPPGTNAKKLAEIIGAGVLAGEISLLGALAAQHLARAHQQLGRG